MLRKSFLLYALITHCTVTAQSFGPIKTKSFYFDVDNFSLNEESMKLLKVFTDEVKNTTIEIVEIIGYIEGDGAIVYNKIKSKKRIDAIKNTIDNSITVHQYKPLNIDYAPAFLYTYEDGFNWRRVDITYRQILEFKNSDNDFEGDKTIANNDLFKRNSKYNSNSNKGENTIFELSDGGLGTTIKTKLDKKQSLLTKNNTSDYQQNNNSQINNDSAKSRDNKTAISENEISNTILNGIKNNLSQNNNSTASNKNTKSENSNSEVNSSNKNISNNNASEVTNNTSNQNSNQSNSIDSNLNTKSEGSNSEVNSSNQNISNNNASEFTNNTSNQSENSNKNNSIASNQVTKSEGSNSEVNSSNQNISNNNASEVTNNTSNQNSNNNNSIASNQVTKSEGSNSEVNSSNQNISYNNASEVTNNTSNQSENLNDKNSTASNQATKSEGLNSDVNSNNQNISNNNASEVKNNAFNQSENSNQNNSTASNQNTKSEGSNSEINSNNQNIKEEKEINNNYKPDLEENEFGEVNIEGRSQEEIDNMVISSPSRKGSRYSKNIPSVDMSKRLSEINVDNLDKSVVLITLNIQFEGNKPITTAVSIKEMKDLFNFLYYNPAVDAFIRGHVCCGDEMTLSKKRAKHVYKELIKRGISEERLRYQGFSNSLLLVNPERSEADRRMNRRVDIILSKNKNANNAPVVISQEVFDKSVEEIKTNKKVIQEVPEENKSEKILEINLFKQPIFKKERFKKLFKRKE